MQERTANVVGLASCPARALESDGRPSATLEAAEPEPRRSVALSVAFACAPIVVVWVATVLVHPRPYWVHFYDPELIYLGSGLRLLAAEAPHHFDNPGAPVQLLSALILLATGKGPEAVDRFRFLGYVVALSLCLAAAWMLFRTVLAGIPRLAGVAAIWGFFVTPQALQYLTVWSPEILFFPFGALLAAVAWRFFEKPDSKGAVAFGLSLGACLALKLTFLGWIPALVIAVLSDVRRALRVRLGWIAVAGAGIALGFILMTADLAPRYPEMLRWSQKLTSGAYAPSGWQEAGPPDLMSTASGLARSAKGWLLCLLGAAVVAARGLVRSRALRPILVLCIVGTLATFVLAVRHGGAGRYLLPAAPLLLLLLVLASTQLGRLAPAMAVVAAVLVSKAIALELASHEGRILANERLRVEIDERLDSICQGEPRVLFGWRQPQPSFALRIMIQDPLFHARVSAMYPLEGYYERWRRRIFPPAAGPRWDIAVLSDEDAASFTDYLGEPAGSVDGYRLFTRGARCRDSKPNPSSKPRESNVSRTSFRQ